MNPGRLLAPLLLAAAATTVPAQSSHVHPHHLEHAHGPDHGADHDHATLRRWHDARTGATWEGWLLAVRADQLTLELHDGGRAMVALADLRPEDCAQAVLELLTLQEFHGLASGVEAAPAPALSQPPTPAPSPAAPPLALDTPWQADAFLPFAPAVRTRWDAQWLYVESDGLPHSTPPQPLMVGIRAWQQQVPLPQDYTGANAWQIPLHPVLSNQPVSARTRLRRGAIALAANGVPIFNALNNRGEDAFALGELDDFGGHSGRADDYHYHIAPLHLQQTLGPGRPLAFALDGLPLYGLFDAKAKAGAPGSCPRGGSEPLDEWNGHFAPPTAGTTVGTYHYHASTGYPYVAGGMRGVVTVLEDQIEPQPRTTPVRPALTPLRGARITGFRATGARAWSLTYTLQGTEHRVDYRIGDDGRVGFDFVGPGNAVHTETWPAARGGRDGDRGGRGDGGAGRGQGGRRRNQEPPPAERPASQPRREPAAAAFALRCPALDANGLLAARHTCDGAGTAPPFTWSGLPQGTASLALVIHHLPPDGGERVYLVLHGIPATATGVAENQRDLGTFGSNSVDHRAAYAPPCSQGPGVKRYTATLYALRQAPALPAGRPATRQELLAAIGDQTLGTATVELRYARAQDNGPGGGQRGPQRDGQAPRGHVARLSGFHTEVPAHDVDLVLAQPGAHEVLVTVAVAAPTEAVVEYWRAASTSRQRTEPMPLVPGQVRQIPLTGLSAGAEYRYRLLRRSAATAAWAAADEHGFRTQPPPGSAFTCTVTADTHLDSNMDPRVYMQTLRNALADQPDFHLELGDTFMTDKRPRFRDAAPQYDAQRWYFGQLCHSAPLLLVLGNHDGESGTAGTSDQDMGPWSFAMRTARFPPPAIRSDGIFTGRTTMTQGRGANYYAFTWGEALLIVLDPFWPTTERIRGAGGDAGNVNTDQNWVRTLGRPQYDWLATTLAASRARYKLVFLHHLVGGLGKEARGGVESAPFFEWGGANADGSPGFAAHRPGWPRPIHDLLVQHGVTAVFHGHDHLYVRGERDGIVYQCVPQPGNARAGTRSAAEYGYQSGTILASPGHLRLRVAPEALQVDYVHAALAEDTDGRRGGEPQNGTVTASYRLTPKAAGR